MRYKQILLKPFNNKVFYKNNIFKIDNGNNIFYRMKEKLQKIELKIDTVDIKISDPTSKYIYCDAPYIWEVKLWINLVSHIDKNILFCFESPIVNPFSHSTILHPLFKRVYTWNDKIVDNKKRFKFYIPQLNKGAIIKPLEFENKKFLVAVFSNKKVNKVLSFFSPYKKELYGERLMAIRYFGRKIPDRFSLYGRGWNKFGFQRRRIRRGVTDYLSCYKGEVHNKLKLLSRFKYCLAFENCEAPGYITEKIFDCFKSGCVPIYLGAINIQEYIPRGSFVNAREFDTYESLLKFLLSINEKRYEAYLNEGRTFLNSMKTQNLWFEDAFKQVFLESVS